jgi:hypothetical protein
MKTRLTVAAFVLIGVISSPVRAGVILDFSDVPLGTLLIFNPYNSRDSL